MDSQAVRQRRYRLHKAGNHSLCKNCAEMIPELLEPPVTSIEDAVTVFTSRFSFDGDDPRGVLALVAIRVGHDLDRCPSASLSHELSAVLQAVADSPGEAPDKINELQMRRHVRRLADVLDGLATSKRLPRPNGLFNAG